MPKRITTTLTAVSLATLLTCITGCTATPEPEPSPTSVPTTPSPTPTAPSPTTPTPTKDPEVAAAEDEVLTAYRSYWEVSADVLADPNAPLPEGHDRYIADKALAGLGESVLWAQQNGVRMIGSPMIDPVVESIELGSEARATITDCVDYSDWVLVMADSGELASPDEPAQTRVTADAWASIYDGRWVVREVTLNRDESC